MNVTENRLAVIIGNPSEAKEVEIRRLAVEVLVQRNELRTHVEFEKLCAEQLYTLVDALKGLCEALIASGTVPEEAHAKIRALLGHTSGFNPPAQRSDEAEGEVTA